MAFVYLMFIKEITSNYKLLLNFKVGSNKVFKR